MAVEYFRPVAPETVPASIRNAALEAYAFAVRDLGLRGLPTLVWAVPEDEYPGWDRKRALGYSAASTDGGKAFGVYRRDDRRIVVIHERHETTVEVVDTVLHELRHAWQHEQGWPSAWDELGVRYWDRGSERDARAYAAGAVRRVVATRGDVPEWRLHDPSPVVEAAERWLAAVERVFARGEAA